MRKLLTLGGLSSVIGVGDDAGDGECRGRRGCSRLMLLVTPTHTPEFSGQGNLGGKGFVGPGNFVGLLCHVLAITALKTEDRKLLS